ncbi:multidrug transporter subunit MdtN [Pandoraea sp. XJJ-1]|uniref:multidrug transporter subunit MdtN n=1 Tax=Pandoraea sp. XJJ-1 TaxID=3002643 RepID=UPI002281A8E7|nr:multidrug transporter subunit MdtN [Pandoraea sp. XJJ-1]WAL83900.1 multidrug transporter subunit MdtN [Pandoraea sp. XJJ-1]
MKMAGKSNAPLQGRLIAMAIILIGVSVACYAIYRSSQFPSTDDATIDADVVHVATPVGGRIVKLAVQENQRVAKGDVLYEIDPVPYRLVLAQARADLDLARASLDTRQKTLYNERANASIADDQTSKSMHNYALTTRNVERLAPLAAKGYVSQQQLDQAQVAQRDAELSVRQAKVQKAASAQSVGDEAGALATVRAREAATALAQHNLDDTVVRAPHNGYVTGLAVLSGETVAPGQSLFTLVHADEWFAVANFREGALSHIQVGDCATVYSMIDRSQAISGKVVGIGAGISDAGRINLPRALPIVQSSVNWVRVAQRFPVRVELHEPAERLVRIGASAVVEISHGAACR